MKKFYVGAIASVCGLLLLTGCGGSGNKVTCTASFEEDGHKYSGEVVAELDSNDKVKDATISMTFENSDDADQFYSMIQMVLGMAKSFAEEGQEVPNIDIKKDGKKIIIDNYAEFAKLNSGEEDEVNIIGMTKDEFIKQLESDEDEKWSCK